MPQRIIQVASNRVSGFPGNADQMMNSHHQTRLRLSNLLESTANPGSPPNPQIRHKKTLHFILRLVQTASRHKTHNQTDNLQYFQIKRLIFSWNYQKNEYCYDFLNIYTCRNHARAKIIYSFSHIKHESCTVKTILCPCFI